MSAKRFGSAVSLAYSVTRVVVGLSLVASALLAARPASAANGQTIVSLTFDDGRRTQSTNARPELAARGLHGTFFLNSGSIDKQFACCMTWPDAQGIAADGNEIGGHTYDHKDLTASNMTYDQAVYQVCHDRDVLISHGFSPASFAYPTGAYNRTFTLPDGSTKSVRDIVRECGYTSGRAAGGVSASGPTYAETIPPKDPYATRTPSGNCTNNTYCEQLTAQKLEAQITAASSHGGGWLQLVFHEVCADTDNTCMTTTWRPIKRSEFASLLDWLNGAGQSGGAPAGTTVLTVDQVIRGEIPDLTAPTTTISCDGGPCSTVFTGPVTVSLSASDDRSGVDVTRYTLDGADPDASSPAYGSPFTVSSTTTVKFRSWDTAGNVEPTNTQVVQISTVDLVPPTTTISCDGSSCSSGWYTTAVSVSLSATDAGSGVAATRYTLDGTDPTESSPTYTASFSVSAPTTVKFRSWDGAGNVEPTNTRQLQVDTNRPSVALTSPRDGSRAKGGLQLVAKAADAGSGLASVVFYVDGVSVGTDTSSPYKVAWDSRTVANGTHQVYAVAIDVAGNQTTSPSATITVAN